MRPIFQSAFRRFVRSDFGYRALSHRPTLPVVALGFAAVVSCASSGAQAAEGQWMPEQIASLDADKLKAMGLNLTPAQLWDGAGGILRGVVNVRGCSGALVSDRGLVATNHHCAYGALQAASREAGQDYLKTGVNAQTADAEVRAPGLWIQVLEHIDDVSADILGASKAATSDQDRARIVEKRTKELLIACEKKHPARRCRIEPFSLGSRFLQFVTLELRDIRMVFAPPTSLGNYGGEIDNWMWPRHAADVTFVRGYVAVDGNPAEYSADNVAYKSPVVLPLTATGVDEGSFVMTVGYPGKTQRYLSASEVDRQLKQVFPGVIETFGTWMDIQEAAGAAGPKVKLKVAACFRSLANRHKNARGMVDGMVRMRLLDRRKSEDAALCSEDDGTASPVCANAKVLAAMDTVTQAHEKTFRRDLVLHGIRRILPGLSTAIDLDRRQTEILKPETERVERYMERNAADVWSNIERNLRDYDPGVEAMLLDDILRRLRALPPEVAATVALGEFASTEWTGEKIVAGSKLGERTVVDALFNAPTAAPVERELGDSAADLEAARTTDALLRLGHVLALATATMEDEHLALDGKMLDAGPKYFAALKKTRSGPLYPDANGTLRFSYAQVRGYASQDGLYAVPQTTLEGAIAKHTGIAPFDLPAKVRAKAAAAASTAWADGELGALPVNFLSTSDTTGGNSGSPVLDGDGRLVGFNFDRVWENIAGDFGYHPSRSRNVVVDARYVLWLLDKVYDAGPLLDELGVASLRAQTDPVDVADTSGPATHVAWQAISDRGQTPPKLVAGTKNKSKSKGMPKNTSAIIVACIIVLGGIALLIGRRRS